MRVVRIETLDDAIAAIETAAADTGDTSALPSCSA